MHPVSDKPNLNKMYPPPLFEDYISWIQKRSVDEVPYNKKITVIPTSLKFEAALELESPSLRQFYLASLDATKICFAFTEAGFGVRRDAETFVKEELKTWQERHVAIRALTSLASEKGKPLWPVPADATRLEESAVVSDEVKEFDTSEGTIVRKRVLEYTLCGPVKITNETKFIVITTHQGREGKPSYKDLSYGYNDRDKRGIDRDNQDERMFEDGMTLIVITDGKPDLSL